MGNFSFLLPVTMSLFGLVFLAIGWSAGASARVWGIAFISGAAGFLAPVLPVPVTTQSLFGNAAFLASFYCYGEALLIHFGMPRFRRARLLLAFYAYAAIAVAVVGMQNLNLELAISDVAIAALLGAAVAIVLFRAKNMADRILVAVSAVVVADILVRLFIFNVLIGMSAELTSFATSAYTYYMQVSVGVLSVAFALAALGSIAYRMIENYRIAAERDPLTGLLNRRGFDAAIGALNARAKQGVTVLTFDIDHFKLVNDHYGHAAGDHVLNGLSHILISSLPAKSINARFGGEEFVSILVDMPLATAISLSQSIRAQFAHRDWREVGIDGRITLSIGVAQASHEISLEQAMMRADKALYASKSSGRNAVTIDAGDTYIAGLRSG